MQKFSPRRLREHRERAGLRREAVAVAIGRSADMVASYEQGRQHLPPLEVLERLATAVGCDVADLFEPAKEKVR